MNVDDKDPETREKLCSSHDQKTVYAETQTTKFEYLSEEAVLQPFTKEYLANRDDRVRFYTDLLDFDVLKATIFFISLFITQRSKSLFLFREFNMVLMTIRLNVPLQDFACRFGISLSTVSRTFSTWLTAMDIRLSPIIK